MSSQKIKITYFGASSALLIERIEELQLQIGSLNAVTELTYYENKSNIIEPFDLGICCFESPEAINQNEMLPIIEQFKDSRFIPAHANFTDTEVDLFINKLKNACGEIFQKRVFGNFAEAKQLFLLQVEKHPKKKELTHYLNILEIILKKQEKDSETSIRIKTRAIVLFQKRCLNLIDDPHSNIMKAVTILTTSAAMTLATWFVGLSICMLAGICAGPGAFFIALAAGKAAEIAITILSGAVGLTAAGLASYGLFKNQQTKTAMEAVTQEASRISELIA